MNATTENADIQNLKNLLDAWDAQVAAGTPSDELVFDDLAVQITAAENKLGIDPYTGTR